MMLHPCLVMILSSFAGVFIINFVTISPQRKLEFGRAICYFSIINYSGRRAHYENT